MGLLKGWFLSSNFIVSKTWFPSIHKFCFILAREGSQKEFL